MAQKSRLDRPTWQFYLVGASVRPRLGN